ncbi:MAG: hypothetical protein HON53_13145 [Planctomycetaceae bacterium]|jgi:hypothetical protein|nr:hypothetical protein [Planctomycetaceae bacterium]MBT6155890.1 hypothetical protein [Planctomycetaceae bacterium]MBT6485313.1 hypothetical protein [Planctomycetaceae bacterium]MBT6496618.1 hypothetical protein [Planctomycetaceae bacterium]
MKSPFAIFRKNARVLTVVLTGLAMFAFVVMDQLRSNPQLFPILMAGLLLGCAFWILGRPSGHGNEYGVGGLLLGVVLMAYVVPTFTGADAAVELTIGSLSEQDVNEHLRRRQLANQFVAQARSETEQQPSQPPFNFGADGKDSAAMSMILRHEADQMGIGLSDKAVNDFIMEVTDSKLSQKQFKEIRMKLRLSETELYEILRENLRANLALQMLVPREYTTPAQFWEYYRRLNVKQEIQVAAIPVSDFVPGVGDPSDSDVLALFDQYKNNAPTGFLTPEPAFKQPRKIRIAYLEVDYEQVSARIQKDPKRTVTDEEVEQFYEENKAIRYREPSSGDDEQPPFDLSTFPGSGLSTPPDEDKPIDPVLKDDPLTEKQPSETDKPKTESPDKKSDDASKSNPDDKADDGAQFSVSDDSVSDNSASDNSASDDTATDSKADTDDEPAPPALPETPPKYFPLDDELKDEIRDELLHDRVTLEVEQIRVRVEGFIRDLEDEYIIGAETAKEPTAEEKAAQAKTMTDAIQKYATAEGLRYVELELLGFRELSEKGEKAAKLWNEIHGAETQPEDSDLPTLNYLIAQAIEPTAVQDFNRSEPPTTLQVLFGRQDERLFSRESAQDPISNNQYVYWKLEDKASEVPTLEDPDIRKQVVAAWKEQQARKPAEERATELAKRVREALAEKQTMEQALKDQTVTGKSDGLELTVQDTGELFSWLTIPTAQSPIAFIKPPPALSTIAAVEKAGNDFMRTAFDGLDVGEVGVAPNADMTAYHIILVKNRIPETPEGDAKFHEDFSKETLFGSYIPQLNGATSTYYYLTDGNQGAMTGRWRQKLLKKYDYKRSK